MEIPPRPSMVELALKGSVPMWKKLYDALDYHKWVTTEQIYLRTGFTAETVRRLAKQEPLVSMVDIRDNSSGYAPFKRKIKKE